MKESGRGSLNSPGGTEENHENLSHNSQSPGREWTRDLTNTKQEC
jgi:hypothetical protein